MPFSDSLLNDFTAHNVDLLRFDAATRRRIRAQMILLRDELTNVLSSVDFSSVRRQARLESLLTQVEKIIKSNYRGGKII